MNELKGFEPVAEVMWYEPLLHDEKGCGRKIIDASMEFMDAVPLGTKLYTADQLAAQLRQRDELLKHRDALLIDLAASLGREDELMKDAERYRWLEGELFTDDSGKVCIANGCYVPNLECERLESSALAAAIDAAIAKVQP